jgi:hypothetical protein
VIQPPHRGEACAQAKHQQGEDLVDLSAVRGERQQQAFCRHAQLAGAHVFAGTEEGALLVADRTMDALDEIAIVALRELVDIVPGGIAPEGGGDGSPGEPIAPAVDAVLGDVLGDQEIGQEPRYLRGVDVGAAGHAAAPTLFLPIGIHLPVQGIDKTIDKGHRALGARPPTLA